jgi:hypothetical protein
MVASSPDTRRQAFQKWASLLIVVGFGVGAVVGHFTGAPFKDVMRLAFYGTVAWFVLRRFWR